MRQPRGSNRKALAVSGTLAKKCPTQQEKKFKAERSEHFCPPTPAGQNLIFSILQSPIPHHLPLSYPPWLKRSTKVRSVSILVCASSVLHSHHGAQDGLRCPFLLSRSSSLADLCSMQAPPTPAVRRINPEPRCAPLAECPRATDTD